MSVGRMRVSLRLEVCGFERVVNPAVVGAVVAMMLIGDCGRSADTVSRTARVYAGPGGWSLRMPAGTSVERSERNGMGAISETTFADFAQRSAESGSSEQRNIDLGPPRDGAGEFPRTGVALRLMSVYATPVPGDLDDSAFPLRMSTFTATSGAGPVGVGPAARGEELVADGQRLFLTEFIGRDANLPARARLHTMIALLRFAHERPGASNDGVDHDLGSPARFPIGSFTLVNDPSIGPVYVIHAPGGPDPRDGISATCANRRGCVSPGSFYAISENTAITDARPRCLLRLLAHDELGCANSTARWDRLGDPLNPVHGSSLTLIIAKLTWDHQLTLAGTARPGGPQAGVAPSTQHAERRAALREAHLLWPNWTNPPSQ